MTDYNVYFKTNEKPEWMLDYAGTDYNGACIAAEGLTEGYSAESGLQIAVRRVGSVKDLNACVCPILWGGMRIVTTVIL